ncbi:acetyl-CoA acetyltransferase [Sandaracinobacteroides saxicola]|uniref:Acetyl-CoA acetyltransferase n=1 Tax=Sandaracinobacteroides saxicola TaxID=2759707 RepID=A0A7G5IHI7_9SPHN|nr:acetyl-CoA acetyltransferase [Sandaracinobacteroides saxicola]QMW22829.1 acetyl-CoA acetyltransferase [Sandaracinobacteroides saxicola]
MTLPSMTPVLVGIGQYVDRGDAMLSPQDMLAAVARRAIADCGGHDVAAAIDAIAVVKLFADSAAAFAGPFGGSSNYPRSIANRIGASPRRCLYGPVGGNTPQMLANLFAQQIANGEHDVVLLAGCEPIRTQARAQKAGLKLDWREDAGEPETLGKEIQMISRHELLHGIALPVNVYPLFETALAAHYGRSMVAQRAHIGELMARFTRVAAANPFAQLPVERSAAEIITPTDDNRYIGYPYTKYLNSNMFVDQAAALLLMSTAAADRLGVPAGKRVHLHGCADTQEKILVSERVDYHSSPAVRIGAAHALAAAEIRADDIAHMDLYSCFSSAVQIAADSIGIAHDDPRGLTLTGGLCYFGGPGNNYSMHGIAEVAARCRANPGSHGFVFANGGYLTKHSFGVWNTTPRAFERADPAGYQAEVDAMASPRLEEAPAGEGRIEAFTVIHDRGRPAFAIVIGRQAGDGARFLAQVHDGCGAMVDADLIGAPVTVTAGKGGPNMAVLAS